MVTVDAQSTQWHTHLGSHGTQRIQARCGILGDELHGTTESPQIIAGIMAIEQHGSPVGIQQSDEYMQEGGLAAT